mgnify:CR=1 FL=1
MSLGEVIKNARLRKNIKQAEIAKEIGVTVQTYIKWEANETEPKASQVAKLSKAYLRMPSVPAKKVRKWIFQPSCECFQKSSNMRVNLSLLYQSGKP